MQLYSEHKDINDLRTKIFNTTLFIGAFLGGIAFLISLLNYSSSGFRISYISDFLIVCILLIVAIGRNRITISLKSIIIIIAIIVLVITDTIKLGVYSDSKILLIIIPFFSFLTYSLRKTGLIFLFALASFLFIGFLHYSGRITASVNYAERAQLANPWFINVVLISVVGIIIVIIINLFYNTFNKLISDLQNKNQEISLSEQNYREIFDNTADAIFIHDLKGNIIDVNKVTLNTYGYTKEEIRKLSLADLSSGVDSYTVNNARKKVEIALQEGKSVFDWQAKSKSGKVFWVEVILKKTEIHGDERILAVVTDIDEKKKNELQLEKYRNHLEIIVEERTDEINSTNKELIATNEELYIQREELKNTLKQLKKAQNQLTHSEKMASLGILSAGIAHEINNPLNFMQGGVSGLQTYFSEHEQLKSDDVNILLGAIAEGIERTSLIVTSLNHFSRQGESKTEACNIHEIIDNCLVILKSKLKNIIEIEKNYCETEPILTGNDGKLHQVFLNILKNSIQAIHDKGKISISTQIENKKITIKITDTGVGINKKDIDRVTDPFFTTKQPGQGTGLGLSITYNIITEHHGKIKFEPAPLEGTIVIITLPKH